VDFANQNYRSAQFDYASSLARQHDLRPARAYLRDLDLAGQTGRQIIFAFEALEDWPALARLWAGFTAEVVERARINSPAAFGADALAKAHLGDMAGAEALIAATPADCDDCLVARAKLAEMQGEHARADWWFARDVARTPSIPFANFEWGQALLERGQPDAAIEKFKLANQKGPHFADPLEGWGEALMAKNQSHLALAKFAEAEKYAPKWGRLHLKWGEALVYAGKRDEAKAQFVRAAQLDLTPSEKSELAGHSHV
jgi:tetratricopeptide (TPR) repeat protein